MNKFLQLPADTRRTIYEQVSLRLGIDDPKAIEKDIWVTGILQAVYTLPYADKLVFKGGSSLSKIWNLISRFSEDIDLAIDRSVFGLEGDLTKRQLKNCVKHHLCLSRMYLPWICRELSMRKVWPTTAR